MFWLHAKQKMSSIAVTDYRILSSDPQTLPASLVAPTVPGFSILMATRYGRLGASSRLRLLQYCADMTRAGLRTTIRAFFSDGYVRALYGHGARLPRALAAYLRAGSLFKMVRAHDLVWIEKELLPFLPYRLEKMLLGDVPYVLDFDDPWFLRYENAPSRLVRWLLGDKFSRLVAGAALTIVANESLRDWAIQAGAREVLLLPTVIDLDRYGLTPEPDASHKFTIGWIGTPVTAPYLQSLAEPLRILAAEAPLELLIIGAPDCMIEGVDCRHVDWSEASEAEMLSQCHVGIMPLPDDDWARGKSGYKLIQYMAAGRPMVASPVGANRAIVNDGKTGFLAASGDEWCDSLRILRDDKMLRRKLGAAAHARVAEAFSLGVTAPQLIAALSAAYQSTRTLNPASL